MIRRPAKVAVYLRVSTTDQTTANQRPDLARLVEQLVVAGDEVLVEWFEDVGSGATTKRPAYQRMFEAMRRRRFDTLAIWSISRLGRNKVQIAGDVHELQARGVRIVSVRESWLDQADPRVRGLLVDIFGWMAEEERAQLVDRTRAGMRRAAAEGVRFGRPRKSEQVRRALQLRGAGQSITKAAKGAGISPATLKRAAKLAREGNHDGGREEGRSGARGVQEAAGAGAGPEAEGVRRGVPGGGRPAGRQPRERAQGAGEAPGEAQRQEVAAPGAAGVPGRAARLKRASRTPGGRARSEGRFRPSPGVAQ